MKKTVLLFIFLGTCAMGFTQDLPRRVYLGIRMENLTSDARNLMNVGEEHGVLISEVLPGSTAQKAGFQKGDILLSVNDSPVQNTEHLLTLLANEKPGTSFRYELFRAGKKIRDKAIFSSFPEEKYPNLNVSYGSAKTVNGLQRYILTAKPGASGLPALVFIGGIGCYSLDSPFDTNRAEIRLLNAVARAGYVAVRLEKPGVGDASKTSTACSEVSFHNEVSGYVEMINRLKLRPEIDSTQVFIFGHSMGGAMAPLVASQTSVKGIIAYGTIGSNFIEYLAKTRRTIAQAYNMNLEETDDLIKTSCQCAHYYFTEKKSTEEVTKLNSDCGELLSLFDLRSRDYNNELFTLNHPENWRDFEGRALLLWGASDYISSREDHEILTEAVNADHTGMGTMKVLDNCDHGMHMAGTFQEARSNPGPYNPEVESTVIRWLRSQ